MARLVYGDGIRARSRGDMPTAQSCAGSQILSDPPGFVKPWAARSPGLNHSSQPVCDHLRAPIPGRSDPSGSYRRPCLASQARIAAAYPRLCSASMDPAWSAPRITTCLVTSPQRARPPDRRGLPREVAGVGSAEQEVGGQVIRRAGLHVRDAAGDERNTCKAGPVTQRVPPHVVGPSRPPEKVLVRTVHRVGRLDPVDLAPSQASS